MYSTENIVKQYATSRLGLIENNMELSKKVILKKEIIEETKNKLNNKHE
jgi:hypothetical protein